jgi:RNA polymerase sigma factor (sigma-70 family)
MNESRRDFEALQQFVRRGDQAAFAELARRHLDLVYATALRKVGDEGGAEEVAQSVLIALAKKAWRFAPGDSLPAWLYRATLLEGNQWLRAEVRRKRREQMAAELGALMKTPDEPSALRALLPLLDEALLSLREKDRTALLLRFYEGKSLRELGAALGVSEDAAQKRVAGALHSLAQFFQRRGFRTATIATTTAALEQTARAVPQSVATALVHGASQLTPPTLGGFAVIGARLIALTRLQKGAVVLLLALAPTAAWQGTREARRSAEPRLALQENQNAAIAMPLAAATVEPSLEPTRPAQPTNRTLGGGPRNLDYTVQLVGLVNLGDFRAALVEIHFVSPDFTNKLNPVVRFFLRESQPAEDHSYKDLPIKLDLLRIDSDFGNLLLRENQQEKIYEVDLPEAANFRRGQLPALVLSNLDFQFALNLYAELIGRTILCHPQVRPFPVLLGAAPRDKAAAARALERLFKEHDIAVVLEDDAFTVLIPPKLIEPRQPRKRIATPGNLPAGSVRLENASLDQALVIYGALVDRELVRGTAVPNGLISFQNQTPLSKPDMIYAFEVLFRWQGLQITTVGSRYFKVTK